MKLSQKQLSSIRRADARVNLWNGAVSAGKTLASLIAWAKFVDEAPHGGALAIIGKTQTTATRNVVDPLRDLLPAGAVQHTRGADTAVIMGRLVWVLGANDARAEDRIRGLTLAGAYVDEATLLPKGFWNMLLTRLRVPGAKLFATTNPDHPRHPLKLEVIDKAAELGYRVWSFTMDDNPGLDAPYVEQMKASFTGLFYRRFILGEWVAATGAIYDMLDLDARHRVAADDIVLDPDGYFLGVDYGTKNATHAVLLCSGHRRSTRTAALFVVGEWTHSGRDTGRDMTDAEQSRAIRDWLINGAGVRAYSRVRQELVEAGAVEPRAYAVDPSAASLKAQLRRDGVRGLRNAENGMLTGLRTAGSLLALDRLLFVEGAAPVLEGQMLGYVWDDDPAVDEPASGQEDHGCDGFRYAVMAARTAWKPWLVDRGVDGPDAPTETAAVPRWGRRRR
ncbi:MAG: terminase family protein [Nocardioides alkalitolerans]